jgi:hypothetical protein
MIVRASDMLRRVAFQVEDKIIPPPDKAPQNLNHLLPLMPEWLKELLIIGNVLIISREDWYELSPEITTHMEVLKN